MTDVSKVDFLKNGIMTQFNSRAIIEASKRGLDFGISMNMEEIDHTLWVTFVKENESHSFNVPLPYVENGVTFIENNEVKRAVCKYWIEEKELMYEYLDIMYQVICGDPSHLVPANLVKKIIFMQQIVYSFENKNTSVVMYNLQKAINDVVNKLPLHDTYMNSLIMNNRIIIIDPEFDLLNDPERRLQYHIEKSKRYFNRGWTTIGLSDGSLADKNYILATDLKKFTPWGERYHNPQRNLYSTLGMKGDELPLVRSVSMERLHQQGIARKGWNMFTLFVDVPDVWEDQILLSKKAADKSIQYDRRMQCYGELKVKVNQRLYPHKSVLSIAPDGKPKLFDIPCDKAWVFKISESTANVGGAPTKVYNVIVNYIRKIKDGVKITNTAANKGVIRIMDTLGYAVDPRNGENQIPIDVIISSKAVRKRKNFTQIIEALFNNVTNNEGAVIDDFDSPTLERIEERLVAAGFPKDGTWQCYTPYGDLVGICGKVFWGVTHDVEDMLWTIEDTTRTNTKGLRTAGLKFSTVEMRALETRFGKNNPIVDEIMSYMQGSSQLHEYLRVLESKRGNLNKDLKTIHVNNIMPVDQSEGTIVEDHKIVGTIADTQAYPDGFILELPITYQVAVDMNNDVIIEGYEHEIGEDPSNPIQYIKRFNKIYIPSGELRKCWRHDTGKVGLSEIAALVNNIVVISHRLKDEPEVGVHLSTLYKVVYNYFNIIAHKMGTKRGELSTHGMSVRYPFSAKAVATLSNSLPKNTIEIHREMAEMIGVNEGDIVLAERFPCMGFMSLRPQRVHITSNDKCKYTIRASGNSLGSMTLDFDGDVLYIAAFHTPEAKAALLKEWTNPNKSCYEAIKDLNAKMGKPRTKELTLQDYEMAPFAPLTIDTHASIVDKATGVKSHTGPVIAFAYNIMRIMENSQYANNQKANCAVEIFLDKVGNSIFKQKHGVKALHQICVDAICTCDIEALVKEGFKRSTSTIICNTIMEKALALGIKDLNYYHEEIHKKKSRSNIISRIVRSMNKVYHASRSTYEGIKLLSLLRQPAVDIPSRTLKWALSGKADTIRTPMHDILDQKSIETTLYTEKSREIAGLLMKALDKLFVSKTTEKSEEIEEDNSKIKAEKLKSLLTNLHNKHRYVSE